jgi:hypothetical protein
MAALNGSNGNGAVHPAPLPIKLPNLDDLRRAYDEGVPQTLLSGLEVVMRPVKPETLLMSGNIPDILTPLVLEMMFPKPKAEDDTVFPDEVDDNPVSVYLTKERQRAAEVVEFVKSVDAVCEAALIDPSIVPYLSLSDRMWIFRLAFLPAEALKNFRLQPAADVESVPDEQGDAQQAEPTALSE